MVISLEVRNVKSRYRLIISELLLGLCWGYMIGCIIRYFLYSSLVLAAGCGTPPEGTVNPELPVGLITNVDVDHPYVHPTDLPTGEPTEEPTVEPSAEPSEAPEPEPSVSPEPSPTPTPGKGKGKDKDDHHDKCRGCGKRV
jgi:hypothetical protein